MEINLEEAGALEPGEILSDSVRQWRSDCQAGQFKIGAGTFRGSKLDMELVGAEIREGEFFGYPLQRWLGLVFVDSEGVLSTILFKTESMDNFAELRRVYRLKGQSLLGKTVTARMVKRSSMSTGKPYFAVEFEVTSEGQYATAIAHFRQQSYVNNFIRMIESKPDDKKAA